MAYKDNTPLNCSQKLTILEGNENVPVSYNLNCIIFHQGGYDSGHYFIQGRDTKSGDLFNCSDESITKIKFFSATEAYVLIYSRQ